MFGQQKENFSKQYRRRALCSIVLYYVTFLSAFRDDGREMFSGNALKLSEYRPFAPHAQVITQNEIQIKWLPTVLNRMEFRVYYELYTDDDIEYVGYDLTHVAKRLHFGEEYMFRIRVCNSVTPGDCSQFSTPRFQKLPDSVLKGAYHTTIQPKMRVFPMIALLAFFATISVIGLLLLNYLSHTLEEIQFDINDEDENSKKKKKICNFENSSFTSKHQTEKEQAYSYRKPKESHIALPTKQPPDYSKPVRSANEVLSSGNDLETNWQTYSGKKSPRKRSKTISHYCSKDQSGVHACLDCLERNNAASINDSSSTIVESIVVAIDNSNIFIGARETVCNTHEQIKPKHVKLRLQQLLMVAENNRSVSRGFTAGSSPPSSEHVWHIYRRHGYTVDLEERRGKDEQRVDESLHLAIYKALVELSPQTLTLVTGDGNKGKSRGDTSFIGCASKAIELGWKVEVLSWKHSLSTEWCKLAARKDRIKIIYLDKYVNILTQIERPRNFRRKLEDRMD